MKTYSEKDMMDVVVDGETVQVPKAWKGTELMPLNAEVGEEAAADAEVTVPDGEPTVDWTQKQLQAYADGKGVKVSGSKAEMVDQLQKASVI